MIADQIIILLIQEVFVQHAMPLVYLVSHLMLLHNVQAARRVIILNLVELLLQIAQVLALLLARINKYNIK